MTETLHHTLRAMMQFPVIFFFGWYLITKQNKMCYETQMPPYEANSRGGHHCQNPRSRFQNLWLQYKGLVTSNMHMKYKSPTVQPKRIPYFPRSHDGKLIFSALHRHGFL
jgi:hypothetical protein